MFTASKQKIINSLKTTQNIMKMSKHPKWLTLSYPLKFLATSIQLKISFSIYKRYVIANQFNKSKINIRVFSLIHAPK